MPHAALITLTLALAAMPAVAQTCSPVQFSPGPSTATIRGSAPAEDTICYTFAARPGQNASLSVTGNNVIVSVIGVGDARTAFSFKTKAQNQFVVGQLMRAAGPERFTATLAVR